jgi:PTH1 family peptidyl-tRNA hydrolase
MESNMFFRRKQPSVSWIIVFLGNPGAKYAYSRHNVGFMTAEIIEKAKNIKITRVKFKALTAVSLLGGEKVLLMKPQTYMNLSGDAVSQAMAYYKVPLERVLVISDDVSMPVGKLRIRRSGSAGGHNGLKDIIAKCGGDSFPRLKIGVGSPPPHYDMADWVLGTFKDQDAVDIDSALERATRAIDVIIEHGIDKAMAEFN